MRAVIASCVLLGLVGPAAAQDVVESTSVDAKVGAKTPGKALEPFLCKIDKMSVEYDSCHVLATVTSNEPGRLVQNLTVLVTGYDAAGKLLGRTTAEVSPSDDRTGRSGHVECSFDTDKVLPAKVECKVLLPLRYDDMEVAKSAEKTTRDTPLEFQLQKVDTGYQGLEIWGKVTNPGDQLCENPQVIITLYGPDGKFLGRGQGDVSPSKVGKGDIGYVNGIDVKVGPWKPVKLEWKVISSQY